MREGEGGERKGEEGGGEIGEREREREREFSWKIHVLLYKTTFSMLITTTGRTLPWELYIIISSMVSMLNKCLVLVIDTSGWYIC